MKILIAGHGALAAVLVTVSGLGLGDPGGAPSDAVVLFDGKDLSKWVRRGGGEARWIIKDGVATVNGGDIVTKDKFGDAQLHIEWRIPAGEKKSGNSGLKLHERYEIQILNSYGKKGLSNGQAGAVYKQHAPLVNVCRPPGEWQSYDVIFRAPRFDAEGKRIKKGTFTVFHNGVLIHDNVAIHGPTNSNRPAKPVYKKPLLLQDHGSPVSFRNIWIRPLTDQEPEAAVKSLKTS